jgi:NAD-dependent deacetylase
MIRIGPADRVFVLTGAGISAESGIATFRDSDGLWKGIRFEEVATPEAWRRDPTLVWNFYSARRKAALGHRPNPAHFALAQLESALGDRLLLCTQNVDNLHEQAGSARVLHMHGNLFQSRCETCGRPPFDDRRIYGEDEELPKCLACGALVRPHICWFGETPFHLERLYRELEACTIFVAIGTSGVVHPAAGFIAHAKLKGAVRTTCYVGSEEPFNRILFQEVVLGPAGEMVPGLFEYAGVQGPA